VSEVRGQGRAARTLPAGQYARHVAEDADVAERLAGLCAVGCTREALHLVRDAAAAILDSCNAAETVTIRNLSLTLALNNIRAVATHSEQIGDEHQASWCHLLRQNIVGGAFSQS
jgi:hypothetical protein